MECGGLDCFPAAHFQDVGDVFTAIGSEDDAVLDRPVHRIHAIDFAQGDDLAQVMARVHAALFESLVIHLGLARQAQETHQQALFLGRAPLGE